MTNTLSYEHQLRYAAHTGSINELGVFFESKLHFHNHVDEPG
jgi:hypothetical protein